MCMKHVTISQVHFTTVINTHMVYRKAMALHQYNYGIEIIRFIFSVPVVSYSAAPLDSDSYSNDLMFPSVGCRSPIEGMQGVC